MSDILQGKLITAYINVFPFTRSVFQTQPRALYSVSYKSSSAKMSEYSDDIGQSVDGLFYTFILPYGKSLDDYSSEREKIKKSITIKLGIIFLIMLPIIVCDIILSFILSALNFSLASLFAPSQIPDFKKTLRNKFSQVVSYSNIFKDETS